MSLVRCEKKLHLFNSDVHSICPICGSQSSTIILDDSNHFGESDVSDTEVSQFGFGNVNVTLNSIDDNKLGVTHEISHSLSQRYRLVAPLSEGGMGRIFLAQEVLSGRYVALKILLDRAIRNTAIVQQFVREAVITARLQHPNIVPVYDLGFFSEKKLYYTMRLIDNRKFTEIIEKRDFDIIEKLRILRCVAQAVHYAHEKGLWHRDLKPDNILIGPLGDTYVIDWGLVSLRPGKVYRLNLPQIMIGNDSYYVPEPDRLIEETPEAITGTDRVIGTPLYMSPEQYTGHLRVYSENFDSGISSDVWALGIMLYQILANSHPVKLLKETVISPMEIGAIVCTCDFPQIKTDKKYKSLVELCNKMLSKQPEDRIQSLADFVLETAQFMSNTGSTSTMVYVGDRTMPNGKEPISENVQQHQLRLLKEREQLWAEIANLGPLSFRRRKALLSRLLKLST